MGESFRSFLKKTNGILKIFHIFVFFCLLFLFPFRLFSLVSGPINPSDEVRRLELENKLDQHLFEEVIFLSRELIANDPENLALTELQLRAYLGKGHFERAQKNLNFIKARRQDHQTDYLQALLLFYRKDFKQSEKILLTTQTKVRRYAPLYLLLYRIYLKKNLFKRSLSQLEQYQKLSGKNLSWYSSYGAWLIKKIKVSPQAEKKKLKLVLDHHLRDYQVQFERNHSYFYLRSYFYLIQFLEEKNVSYLKESVKMIDKALLFANRIETYQARKIYLLFLLQDWEKFRTYVEGIHFKNKDEKIRYGYLLALIDLTNLKVEDEVFRLKPLNHRDLIDLHNRLFQVVKLQPNDRLVLFFLEQLFIENRDLLSQIEEKGGVEFKFKEKKEELIQQRYRWAKRSLEIGSLKKAEQSVSRALQLDPGHLPSHELYLEYLKLNQRDEDALAQIVLMQSLVSNQNETWEVKESILRRRLQESIRNRYRLPSIQAVNDKSSIGVETFVQKPDAPRVAVVYSDKKLEDHFFYPYYEVTFSKMMWDYLNRSLWMKIDWVDERGVDQKSYDYLIRFKMENAPGQVKIDLTLNDAHRMRTVDQISVIFRGKNRYERALFNIFKKVQNSIPLTAQVVAINENEVVLNLGKLGGISREGRFRLLEGSTDYLPEQIDDYFSLIKVDSIKILDRLSIGSEWIWVPSRQLGGQKSGEK